MTTPVRLARHRFGHGSPADALFSAPPRPVAHLVFALYSCFEHIRPAMRPVDT